MCLPSSVLRHDYSPATQNHSPPATRLPLQLYMTLVLLVPCQLGELFLQNSVKMSPPGEKLHHLPWALSSLLFFGATIKNDYNIYIALICLSEFAQKQPHTFFPKYPRLWQCLQSLCRSLRNGQTCFVKVKGWMGGQINE